MAEERAKSRLEAVSGHLIENKDRDNDHRREWELEDHPVDVVRELKVRNQYISYSIEADVTFDRLL
jgi:hypothetical protein